MQWTRDEPALYLALRGTVTATAGRRRLTLRVGCAAYATCAVTLTSAAETDVLIVPRALALPPGIDLVADHTARAWSINLIRELERRDPQWELMVEGLLLQGLAWLSRLAHISRERPEWIDEVVELARRQQPLRTIARVVGRHSSHVAREFRRHEGVSVGEFSRRCRLELAARTLKSGRASIAQIALDAGFCDQSHFTNAFRSVFGVTPAVYRDLAR